MSVKKDDGPTGPAGSPIRGGRADMKRRLVLALGAVALVTGLTTVPAQAAPNTQPYVVMVKDGFDPAGVAAAGGVTPTMVFDAVGGFAANLTNTQVKRLIANAAVQSVEVDGLFATVRPPTEPIPPAEDLAQIIGSGGRRIGLLESPTAKVDGIDERIDVDIAILDTGIRPDHPDLNVVGGVNCVNGHGWDDDDRGGHGTMVGGFAAGIDNSFGTVGVAPGARLWAVKVATKRGWISDSAALCGFDWVIKHADVIEVANMSFAGDLKNPGFMRKENAPCGVEKPSRFHEAICEMVELGVTVVAAAGNETTDASLLYPAAYPEVITVSATSDTDGLPGGLGPNSSCYPDEQADDHLAFFSNYGAPVDLAAPGVCYLSTFVAPYWYAVGSGTSFATPRVAGAAALYISTHPNATPAQVQQALMDSAEPGPLLGDPDAYPEGLLNVRDI